MMVRVAYTLVVLVAAVAWAIIDCLEGQRHADPAIRNYKSGCGLVLGVLNTPTKESVTTIVFVGVSL